MAEKETKENIQEETVETKETAATESAACEKEEETVQKSPEELLKEEIEQLKDRVMRQAAEFDNFKKRVAREREDLYSMAVCDTIEKLLPVKDNLERAVQSVDSGEETMTEGVKMIVKQLEDVLAGMGVEPINAVGEVFDPGLHNAVMHEENEEFGENIISEELMRGYTCKGKVVRYAMVKVAN